MASSLVQKQFVKLPAQRLEAVARVKDALAILELQTQDSGHEKLNALASSLMKQMPASQKSDGGQSVVDAESGLMLCLAFGLDNFLNEILGGASFTSKLASHVTLTLLESRMQDANHYKPENAHIRLFFQY